MKRLFANITIGVLSRNSRNFDRLVGKVYILYNADKVKNKYRLYDICKKLSNSVNNQHQLDISYELLYKIP